MNAKPHHLLYAMDRLLAALLLMATLPLAALVAVVTLCLCRRSPFVAHLRVGKDGGAFLVWKFRTMWGVATEADEPELKGKNDARITSGWARLCRKYSLDELPQLAQVVFGQMSLVGPRPITRKELEKYYGADASEVMRLRPGVSGLWQVRGRNALSYHRRKRLDLFLVRHYGAALYFRILCATIPNVLAGKNAW